MLNVSYNDNDINLNIVECRASQSMILDETSLILI